MRKYRNTPTVVDGVRFDSKREARRWGELQLLQRAGAISDLRRQVSFDLSVAGVLICRYRADFVYDDRGLVVVEDVKSEPTKTPLYLVKKKLMKAVHGIEIRET